MNDKNSGILSKITVEARTELIHDMLSDVASLFDRSEEKVGKLVEVLQQQKAAVGHGNWQRYLRENFGGDAAVQRIQHFMRKPEIAKKSLMTFLESNEEPDTAPRSERKTGQVEVVEPEEVDDDPTPDPPTIRKTAKGTEKVKEADKPKTVAITPEILPKESFPEERTLSDWSETQILDFLVATADDPKPRAKRLRKTADKLDPPTKFVKPTLEDIAEYCERRKNSVDPEKFLSYYAANGWKLSNGNKMADWQAAVITWEQRDNGGAIKKDVARIRKRQAKEIVYDD